MRDFSVKVIYNYGNVLKKFSIGGKFEAIDGSIYIPELAAL